MGKNYLCLSGFPDSIWDLDDFRKREYSKEEKKEVGDKSEKR